MNSQQESCTESNSSLISLAALPAHHSAATLHQQMQQLRERLSDLELQNEELRQSQLLMNAERENQTFNIAVLNSLSEHIAVLDRQAIILAVNVAWQQFSQENGAPQSRLNPVGENYFNVCQQTRHGPYDEQAAQAMQGIEAVLAGRQSSFQMEYSCHSQDEQRWFLMHVTALHGAARCAVVSHLDISKRKQAEQALRASESQNRALISAIPDLIFINARDGEYLSVHASNPKMLAVQPEQLLHRKPAEILPGQVADLIMKTIAKALETGVVQEVHYALALQDGTERFFGASVARYTADTTIAIVRDITELEHERQWHEAQLRDRLRLSESDLRASQQSLALAGDAAKLGVWVLDLVLEQVWASEQWRSLFGFTPDEPINMASVLQRIHPDDRAMVSQTLGYAQLRSDSYQVEFRLNLPDGRLCWIASVGHLEFDGQAMLSRGVSLDITQRKQAELELQQKRIEVTHLSRVAMLGELSGALAHELNQPLTAILSNAQAAQRFMMQERVDLNQLAEILRDIVQEDKRAGEIIRRLRLLFKQGETLRQSVDMNYLVLEVADILRHDLIIQGVSLYTELTVEHPVVNADRVQLQQVLINLVMNACDAMKSLTLQQQQQQLIVIRTALDAGDSVQVSVIDRGSGIPSASLEEIFKPFFSTKVSGMGLGLSICRNIVGAYGGELRCENNQDGGASFHFSVPLQSPEAI